MRYLQRQQLDRLNGSVSKISKKKISNKTENETKTKERQNKK